MVFLHMALQMILPPITPINTLHKVKADRVLTPIVGTEELDDVVVYTVLMFLEVFDRSKSSRAIRLVAFERSGVVFLMASICSRSARFWGHEMSWKLP